MLERARVVSWATVVRAHLEEGHNVNARARARRRLQIPVDVSIFGLSADAPSVRAAMRWRAATGPSAAAPAAAGGGGSAPPPPPSSSSSGGGAREAELVSRHLAALFANRVPYEAAAAAAPPAALTAVLYEHQAKALQWMLDQEREMTAESVLRERGAAGGATTSAAAGGAARAAPGSSGGSGGGASRGGAVTAAALPGAPRVVLGPQALFWER